MRLAVAHAVVMCGALATVRCQDEAGMPAPAPSAAPHDALAEGDEIVAAVAKASFRQGTLVKVGDAEVTFEYGPPGEDGQRPRQTVRRQDVWRLDGARAEPASGSHAICRIAMTGGDGALPSWYPCQVKRVAAGELGVVDHLGREHALDRARVLVPSDEAQQNIAAYLATEQRHRGFDRAFEEAGRPPRPDGWDPKPGDAVVIHFVGTSWYGGKVVENKRDKRKVRVSYDGGTWDDRDVPLAEIAPVPSAPAAVSPGAFVITRAHDQSRRWEHNRVVASKGDAIEVENRDGRRRTVKATDVIPMVKP